MKWVITPLILFNLFILTGCSDKQESSGSGNHAWKEQTGAIDRAKGVEQKVRNQADDLQKQIEGETR